jgi:hypothetical protein
MSKYGFDLDGVLNRAPLAQLANDLFDAGHEVYVVTGGLADSGEWTMEARIERLREFWIRYTEIVRCIDPDINKVGEVKGRMCDELGIGLLIDDSYPYLVAAARVSRVQGLLVL